MCTHKEKIVLALFLFSAVLIIMPSYAAITMSEPPADTETPEGRPLKILCSLELQESAEYVYIYLEENSSGKWERITQDNIILPVESAVFCGSLNSRDSCAAEWNVVPSQQAQINLRCKSVYYRGQNMEEVTGPVIVKIGARLESNTIQIQNEDRQKLLDELKGTKSALESMLRSGSYPLGSAKGISDALTTTNAVIDSLESGTISKDEAESKADSVKDFLASVTGKISGKAAEVQPDKKTSGIQNTTIIFLVVAITLTAIAIKHKKQIKLEKASGLEKIEYKPENKDHGKKYVENRLQENDLSVLEKSKSMIKNSNVVSLKYIMYAAEKRRILKLRDEMNRNYSDFKSGKKDIVDYEKERERLGYEIAGAKHEAKTIRDEQQCRWKQKGQ